jgi:hypothetical protein
MTYASLVSRMSTGACGVVYSVDHRVPNETSSSVVNGLSMSLSTLAKGDGTPSWFCFVKSCIAVMAVLLSSQRNLRPHVVNLCLKETRRRVRQALVRARPPPRAS